MFGRLNPFLLRVGASAFLIAAPLGPIFDAKAAGGVLEHIHLIGRGFLERAYEALSQRAGSAFEQAYLGDGWAGSPADILRFKDYHSDNAAPSILRMVIGGDGIAMLAGRARPGSIVYLESAGRMVGTVTVPPTGTWQLQLNRRLAAGDHQIQSLVRLPQGRTVMRGPEIRVAVPVGFEGITVVYEEAPANPARSRDSSGDGLGEGGRLRIGQLRPEPKDIVRPREDVTPRSRTDAVLNGWLIDWLDRSAQAYQDIVIPDLSGRDARFPLALPRGSQRVRDFARTGAEADSTGGDEGSWWLPDLTERALDSTGVFGARIRDWFADAKRTYWSDVVPELSTGTPVSPPMTSERQRVGTPPSRDGARRLEERELADAEEGRSEGRPLPWPLASERMEPLPPGDEIADEGETREPDVTEDEVTEAGSPWPVVGADEAASSADLIDEEERRWQEERIREAQRLADEAREAARQAAERARKSREETERLLAEEEQLKKAAADEARRRAEEARRERDKAAAERVETERAAAEAEKRRQAEAEALRRRAEELAAAASEEIDRKFAEGEVPTPEDLAKAPPSTPWPVVEEQSKTPRRLSLKDSPEDIVEEGSALGDDDEVYIPDAAGKASLGAAAVSKRRASKRASTARRHAVKKKRAVQRRIYRQRHGRKVAGWKRHHWVKRRAVRHRHFKRRGIRHYRHGRRSVRSCLRREFRQIRRAMRQSLRRYVRPKHRYRRHHLFRPRFR